MARLKPCPFCGGHAKVVDYYRSLAVVCKKCGALLLAKSQKWGDAVKQWNTRRVEGEHDAGERDREKTD